MSETFGAQYADAYDSIYGDKDYEAECDLIDKLASKYGSTGSVLDLGCGTGRHAVILARRGWRVTGVDRSEEMLAIARQRAADASVTGIDFRIGDVRSVRVDETFHVALLMFAVLSYQLTDEDVKATLATARTHLRPGGLLIFDVWNGSAVETIGPSSRSKTVGHDGGLLRRFADSDLDRSRHHVTVDYRIEWLDGETVSRSTREQHTVRYFFDDELRTIAADAGLEIIASGAFSAFDRPVDETEWNALYVARAPGPREA